MVSRPSVELPCSIDLYYYDYCEGNGGRFIAMRPYNGKMALYMMKTTNSNWLRFIKRAEEQVAEGCLTDAIGSYEKAQIRGADPYKCLLEIAKLYEMLGFSKVAVSYCRTAMAVVPQQLTAYLLMMEIAESSGDRQGAIEASTTLIKMMPTYVPAYNILGTTLLQVGDVRGAIRTAKSLVQIEPTVPAHRLKLGALYQHEGEISAAVEEFVEVIRLDSDPTVSEAACDALAALDIFQINQILTLAVEDRVFRTKLSRLPARAVRERGYCLSDAGIDLLNDFCQNGLAYLPESPKLLSYQ